MIVCSYLLAHEDENVIFSNNSSLGLLFSVLYFFRYQLKCFIFLVSLCEIFNIRHINVNELVRSLTYDMQHRKQFFVRMATMSSITF